MRGVFLPLLLRPRACYRDAPVVIAWTTCGGTAGGAGHFSACCGVEGALRHVPLVDEVRW